MAEWARAEAWSEFIGTELELSEGVHGPGEDAARAGISARPTALTHLAGWRVTAPAPTAKSWTCSQCGHPGTDHHGASCPPAEAKAAAPFADDHDEAEERWLWPPPGTTRRPARPAAPSPRTRTTSGSATCGRECWPGTA